MKFMAKSAESWVKPDDVPGLIGRKKVDLSIFKHGAHIPQDFIEDFEKANNGIHLERKERKEVKLIFHDQTFEVILTNFDLKITAHDTLQLRWGGKSALKKYLQEKFSTSFEYIQSQVSQKKEKDEKGKIIVPDEIAEYLDFYETDTPFQYRVETITSKISVEPNIWWVNQGDSQNIEYSKGILFAPLEGKDNRPRYHWETMAELKEDDIIIHYANSAIRYVSRVITPAVEAPNPKLAAIAGGANMGRLVEVEYHVLKPIIKINIVAKSLLALDIKQGPIDNTSRVKQGYLFRFNQEGLGLIQRSQPETHWPDFAVLDPIITNFSTWIFQSNPNYYNLAGALATLNEINWSVTRYKDKIHIGDRVYLWQSGTDAGILASTTVMTDPGFQEHDEKEDPFVLDQDMVPEERIAVRLRIDRVFERPLKKETLLKHDILKELAIIKNPQGTNFIVTNNQAQELSLLLASEVLLLNPVYSLEECSQETGIDIIKLNRWINAINRKGQAIIYGPPGTGKTFVADKLGRHLLSGGDGFYELIQFHPAYAYEDFIQGIRPQSDNNGNLSYPMVAGRFINFCTEAEHRTGICVLIIDEINRANLSRVFGELMYLMEYRNQEIPLAGGKKLQIPDNVRIIGTMNTADRSIALVDHALRRRFAFLALQPNYEYLASYQQDSELNIDGLIMVLKQINKEIDDRNFEIGISYFLGPDLEEQIEDIWMMEIYPYLEEVFFDQNDKLSKYIWDKIKEKII